MPRRKFQHFTGMAEAISIQVDRSPENLAYPILLLAFEEKDLSLGPFPCELWWKLSKEQQFFLAELAQYWLKNSGRWPAGLLE